MKERDRRETTRDNRLDALSRFFKVLRAAHLSSGDDGLKKDELITAFETQLSQVWYLCILSVISLLL